MKNLTGAEYAATKYIELTVNENIQLLDFVIKAMHGISKNKAKDILSGRGITVNGKIETQYNYQLTPGCKIKISKHKRSTDLNNKYVKIVYEDKHLIVIEKSAGILSMPATAKQFSLSSTLHL